MPVHTLRRATLPVALGAVPALLLLGSLSGCGGGQPYKTVKISGKVTYDDGSLIQAEALTLIFSPQVKAVDAKTTAKDGTAMVNVADGTFSCASTYGYGDGVIPGKHKIAVQPMKGGVPAPGLVPANYMDPKKTPLERTIDSATTLELKVPKR
jgi:hypothetical protein